MLRATTAYRGRVDRNHRVLDAALRPRQRDHDCSAERESAHGHDAEECDPLPSSLIVQGQAVDREIDESRNTRD